ncbi:PIN domain-containing protein [Nocardioides sp. CCNWLW239]|uniref:type II toxin-antitoxin system VapC family toxin n=1 Tax=Nocardioides sp. CCNWLW239 TaxID=3128902 RepID=UPI00301A3241
MIHIDTHVAVWLYAGDVGRFSDGARELIEAEDVAISPMAELELTWLHEIGRIKEPGSVVVGDLRRRIGLTTDDGYFVDVVALAAEFEFSFTRDPFDRMIAAQAKLAGVELLTKDRALRDNLDFAVWPN